jgi:hypothetical protein
MVMQKRHLLCRKERKGGTCPYLVSIIIDNVHVVFDSAAKYGGVSLNDVLLSGPDLTNSILGIILRFRREQVVAIADIQQMFIKVIHEKGSNI